MRHLIIGLFSIFIISCGARVGENYCRIGNKVYAKEHYKIEEFGASDEFSYAPYPNYTLLVNNCYIAIPKDKLSDFLEDYLFYDRKGYFEDKIKGNEIREPYKKLYKNKDKLMRVINWKSEQFKEDIINRKECSSVRLRERNKRMKYFQSIKSKDFKR